MGKHCEICGTHAKECGDPGVHLSRSEAGKRIVEEMLHGRAVEQRRVDVEKGREAKQLGYESVMEAGAERDAARAAGAGYAQKQAAAREAKIMGQVCDICWRVREECEWPEVHFSQQDQWIEHCNEVLWVMQQAQWAADDKAGRERKPWRVGDRMAEGEGKERAVEEGLRWAEQHEGAYEAEREREKVTLMAEREKVTLTRAAEEADFEKDVQELVEWATGLTGQGFTRMAWEAGGEKGRRAVVWMHGNFTGGRVYTVTVAGGSGVEMRVERADAGDAVEAGGAAGVWGLTRGGAVLAAVESVEKKQKSFCCVS
jgi:hypothetical protein